MKKKMLSTLIGFVLLLGISVVFNACTKNSASVPEARPVNTIQSTAESILSDTLFTNLVAAFITESTLLHNDSNNTTLIEQSNNRLAEQIVYFMVNQKDLNKLNTLERNKVLKFIVDSTKSENYILSNPTILNNLNSLKLMVRNNNTASNSGSIKSDKLSTGEVIDCFISTAVNALGFYGDAIDEISHLLKSGSSTGVLIQAGFSILRNASPWWKVAAIAFQFSNCLYHEL
jgi:hypothetical protein